MASERWLPIPDYEGLYEVSDQGNIRGVSRPGTRGGILRLMPDGRGYLRVSLYKDKQGTVHRVHRLVARAFIGPRPDGHEVRHLDGNQVNNALVNLAYGTHGENMTDKVRHGTHPQASRTHCVNGHEFTEQNTHLYRGKRICVACTRRRSTEHRQQRSLLLRADSEAKAYAAGQAADDA